MKKTRKYILVLNCGSSSIKFAVIEPCAEKTILHGLVQRINTKDASFDYTKGVIKREKTLPHLDYRYALREILALVQSDPGIVRNIVAVGHRVVHGGEKFTRSVVIDDEVLKAIKACVAFAPLHNPANILGIKAAQKAFTKIPQIAVFDTAFHQTMPKHAYIYPIPYEFYEKDKVRRYGFHGTSHRFVSKAAARLLHIPLKRLALIVAHLGNGCSATAVLNGESIDTTMGFTPLEGLVMGTRSGSIDPGLFSYFSENFGYDVDIITDMLNKKSGLLGISKKYSDMRSIEEAMTKGDNLARLAFDIFYYRLAKDLASLSVALGRLDVLVFTGGIGENSPLVRAQTLRWLKMFGFVLDDQRNAEHGKKSGGVITKKCSKPIVLVVPTNEELMIAKDALSLVQKGKND